MPLVNLLNRVDVTAVIHEDSLVFFLDGVFQAIERQPGGRNEITDYKNPNFTSSSQWSYKIGMTVFLRLCFKLLSFCIFISYTVLLKKLTVQTS